MMADYTKIPALANLYLEDSFVLDIRQKDDRLDFALDAVLTSSHQDYREPEPDEQYCYRRGILSFTDADRIDWTTRHQVVSRDATGEADMGNIDFLKVEAGRYHLGGDWGEVTVYSATEPTFRVEQ